MSIFKRILLRTKISGIINSEDLEKRELAFGNIDKTLYIKDYNGNLIKFGSIDDSSASDITVWSSSKVMDELHLSNDFNLYKDFFLIGNSSNIAIPCRYIIREIPVETPNGILREFTLSHTPVVNKECVFLDGSLLSYGDDYTITGTIITFSSPPDIDSKIMVNYIAID